jgi:hypothetical protein
MKSGAYPVYTGAENRYRMQVFLMALFFIGGLVSHFVLSDSSTAIILLLASIVLKPDQGKERSR